MSDLLLTVNNLSVSYGVKEASLQLCAGESLGIVGESGSGKTTLARAILGLVQPAGGEIWWCGERLAAGAARREMQIVFQNSVASLNPRMRVHASISEPLESSDTLLAAAEIHRRVISITGRVGLDPLLLTRYPHELSGGQCQRVAIARALIANPRLLICDEPVSALDVLVQVQIIQLLRELRDERQLSLIIITHSPGILQALCTRVLSMHRGRLTARV